MKKIEIMLVRHGATPANKEHRYLGRTDEALSEEGRDELQSKWQQRPKADMLLLSPMLRCRESAEIILGERMNDMQVLIIPEWKEMDFGRFEMKNYRELNGNPGYQVWIDGGGRGAFPEGENREQFIHRVMMGYEKAMDYCRERQVESVLALVHGGTIMAILSSLTGQDYFDFQVRNGEGYLLTMSGEDQHCLKCQRIGKEVS